jgi:tetratricopeptide (TPR) repeat protein
LIDHGVFLNFLANLQCIKTNGHETDSFTFFSFILISMILPAQNTDWFEKGLNATKSTEQIEYFTRSIELGNEVSASYYCRASAKLEHGDIQGAIDDYSKCIEIDPDDAGAYFNRGMAKLQASVDFNEAMADLVKAYEIDPANPVYINMVNDLYLKKEDYPQGIIFYNKVLKLYPGNASVYCNLGYCHLAMQDYSAAMENFNKSVSLQPEKIDAILGIALLYYYKNDRVNAKKNLDQAKALNPILQQGIAGFEAFKKGGCIYNDRDNEVLKTMFSK